MIPATFVECNAGIIPEDMKSADENFNSPNSVDIILAADALFEVGMSDHDVSIIKYWNRLCGST
jgi:hypothetical protein